GQLLLTQAFTRPMQPQQLAETELLPAVRLNRQPGRLRSAALMNGCKEVGVDVALHITTELGSLDVRGAEVDTRPDACFNHLVREVREAREAPLLAWEPGAGGIERHLVRTEEGCQRRHAGTRIGARAGHVVRVGRRDERRSSFAGEGNARWVEV